MATILELAYIMSVSEDSNPYRSPDSGHSDRESIDVNRYEAIGQIVVAWEKLRPLYNAIGLFLTLVIYVMLSVSIRQLLLCAVVANLCYCAGPLVDGYLAWFGVRHRAITVTLFIVGTVFMMMLAGIYAGSVAFDTID